MSESAELSQLLELTAEIVAAQVGHNQTAPDAVPALIRSVYSSLAGVGKHPEAAARLEPAVPPKKSVFPDFIICLEDGKKLKMLKRHLATSYHMTPTQYREKWDLPHDYPMVAPDYAKKRSTLAKSIGLGHRRTVAPGAIPAARKSAGRPRKVAAGA